MIQENAGAERRLRHLFAILRKALTIIEASPGGGGE